ncbi:MAG: hypothetical protein V1774_08795 [Candidatus Eisenbacteria bacterium]
MVANWDPGPGRIPGHLNSSSDHDVDASEAWHIETGDPAIIVAILDTGVRYFHKDLGGSNASYSTTTAVVGSMWVRPRVDSRRSRVVHGLPIPVIACPPRFP